MPRREGDAPRARQALLSLVAACLATISIAACDRGASAKADSIGTAAAAASPTAERVRIQFERGPCKGTCPAYRVELHGDGTAAYDGHYNVLDTLRHEYTVPAADVRALAAEMSRAGFFGFDGVYEPYATDHPTVHTTLTIGERFKKIEHNFGAKSSPPYLDSLYRRIDALAGTAKWVGVAPDPPMDHGPDGPPPPDGR